jgi:hypothetical protein
MSNEIEEEIRNLLTEPDLCELFGCRKGQVARLRNELQLPFLKITRTNRLYLESDIMKWLIARRKVLNASRPDE